MSATTDWLRERDWHVVMRDYEDSAPYNYAVLDDFLDPARCDELRGKLLDHWGWHSVGQRHAA